MLLWWLTCFLGIVCMGVGGLQWGSHPEQGGTMYGCSGQSVTMPWTFSLQPRERLRAVHWLYSGDFQSYLLASFSRHQFLAHPQLSHRLTHRPPAGLVLSRLAPDDQGNYTLEVEVTGREAGGGSVVDEAQSNSTVVEPAVEGSSVHEVEKNTSTFYRRSLFLQVSDGVMVREGTLRASQAQSVTWDQRSQHWMVQLLCGQFTFHHRPSIEVVWTTPSGEHPPSSHYHDGFFVLNQTSPVKGGNYTCHVPPHLLRDVCAQAALQAHVEVEEVLARVAILEAEQLTLTSLQNQTSLDLVSLANMDDVLKLNLKQMLKNILNVTAETKTEVESELNALRSENEELRQEQQRVAQEMINLKEVKKEYGEDLKTLKENVQQLDNKREQLFKNMLMSNNEVDEKLEMERNASTEEIEQLKQENERLATSMLKMNKDTKNQFQAELKTMKENLTMEFHQALQELTHNLERKHHSELNKAKIKHDRLDQENKRLSHELAILTTNVSATAENLHRVSTEVLSDLRSDLRSVMAGNLISMETKLSQEVRGVEGRVNQHIQDVDNFVTSVRDTHKGHSDFRTSITNKLNAQSKEITALKTKRCETGKKFFQPNKQTNKVTGRYEERRHTQHIAFRHPFARQPWVAVSLAMLDAKSTTNVRVNAGTNRVTTSGFDAYVFEWSDTVIYSATITWIACST